jgi:environmental stress-induced protein Ves
MRIIRHSSFTRVPWRNGGGVTHEAIRVPAAGDSFQWRVSVAEIEASGPFSDFAAYQRFMVLLKGAGVALRFSSVTRSAAASTDPAPTPRELRKVGDLAAFDGALTTRCELLDGPCVDLNLMVAKTLSDVCARVEVLREPRSWSVGSGDSVLVFPIDGGVELESGGNAGVLEPWDLAVLSGPHDGAVSVSVRGRGDASDAVNHGAGGSTSSLVRGQQQARLRIGDAVDEANAAQ